MCSDELFLKHALEEVFRDWFRGHSGHSFLETQMGPNNGSPSCVCDLTKQYISTVFDIVFFPNLRR